MGFVIPSDCSAVMTWFLHWLLFLTVLVYDGAPIVVSENFAAADSSFRRSAIFRGRTLSDTTVSTPNCDTIRLVPYAAELQLLYEYSVEFQRGSSVSLTDLERALAYAVAFQLDTCDFVCRDMYTVRTNAQHQFSQEGKCMLLRQTCRWRKVSE